MLTIHGTGRRSIWSSTRDDRDAARRKEIADENFDRWALGEETGGLVRVIGTGLADSSWTLFDVTVALLVPVLVRMLVEDIPNSASRTKILNCVTEKPGSTYSDIRAVVGLANGTLFHHMRILEKMNLVTSVRDGHLRRFFSVGVPELDRKNRPLGRTEAMVLGQLIGAGPQTNSRLAKSLGISRQRAHYNLKLLRERGLASSEGWTWAASIGCVRTDSRHDANKSSEPAERFPASGGQEHLTSEGHHCDI